MAIFSIFVGLLLIIFTASYSYDLLPLGPPYAGYVWFFLLTLQVVSLIISAIRREKRVAIAAIGFLTILVLDFVIGISTSGCC